MTELPYDNQLLFRSVFGPKQCETIIAAGRALPIETGMISTGNSDQDDFAARRANIGWLPQNDDFQWVYDKLAKVVQKANKHYRFNLSGFTEDAQFTCYDSKGAFYDWHQDGLDGELAGRKLSIVVQLSDPKAYTGGDLELFALSVDEDVGDSWRPYLRSRGSVIVFPAFEYHRVTPLLSGERYSLVCWIGGPPFR